jgi:hypothetical protein
MSDTIFRFFLLKDDGQRGEMSVSKTAKVRHYKCSIGFLTKRSALDVTRYASCITSRISVITRDWMSEFSFWNSVLDRFLILLESIFFFLIFVSWFCFSGRAQGGVEASLPGRYGFLHGRL